MIKKMFFIFFIVLLLNNKIFLNNLNQIDLNLILNKKIYEMINTKQALYEYNKSKALIEKSYGMFDLILNTNVNYSENKLYSTSIFSPEHTKMLVYKLSLSNKFFTGGFLSLDFLSSKTDILYQQITIPGISNNIFINNLNPSYKPSLSLTFTQPILKDFWGNPDEKIIKIGELFLNISKENLKKTITNNVVEIKELYLSYYMAEKILQIKKDFYNDTERLYQETLKLKSLGLREETDVLQAKASMLAAKAELEPAENNLKFVKENFLSQIGYEKTDWDNILIKLEEIKEEESINELTEKFEDTLVENLPDVVIMKYSIEIAKLNKQIADNTVLPSFNIIGSYGLEGFGENFNKAFDSLKEKKYNNFLIGANFSWSFPNRINSGENRIKEEELKKILEQAEFLKNQSRIIIRNTYRNLITAKSNYEIQLEARRLTEKRLNIQKRNFTQGRISLRELIMTQNDLNQAKIKEITSYIEYIKLLSLWNKIIGKYDEYFNRFYINFK